MPTSLTPGVYVEEVPSAAKPIEAAETSVAAFVGLAPGGPVDTPVRIASWAEFVQMFGDPGAPANGPFMQGAHLAHAVSGFFENGGAVCWVVRIGSEDGAGPAAAGDATGTHRRNALAALAALAAIDEVTMVAIPDLPTRSSDGDDGEVRDLQGGLIAHCETAGDRMAILDAPPDLLPQDVLEWRTSTAGYDSKYAALYYPWLEVTDPLTGQPTLVPPCGHVAGVWCRTDATRGVHRAPAGEIILGVDGPSLPTTQVEQDRLNRAGVNCIRSIPGRGTLIWGARTLSSDPEWGYVNVRRLCNYVAESIMQGTQWSVFEPNDEHLWMQLRIAASDFLLRTWREGALMGAKPEQAFFVRCDAETNPPEVVEAGQVICEIGIAPVRPAEFLVFRLSQFTAGASEPDEAGA